ncbi:MAG: U32 family peptidase, partial [Bacteroidota bacterium]
MKELELLCPAKNAEQGKIAINYGADAVYIGAGKFGARSAVGNEVDEIAELVEFAHKFYAKVYVTINTIIYDSELEQAHKLIHDLYNLGVDAIIIQDMGLLELDLPPIPIHASTQTHNYDLEKIKFFEDVGLQRVILARELSVKQIKKITGNTNIELEAFVHGALCVSLSGQCYFSHATTGRSANRGECSQSCRMKYSFVDANNKSFANDKYLLSLKDLNLSESIPSMAMAGVTSFKIEGRLKDVSYVKNVVSLYRQKLDTFISENEGYKRASSGKTVLNFSPDAEKTFNRGYTDYFANGRHKDIASFNTPKSVGKYIGEVIRQDRESILIINQEKLNNGDGLCFFDDKNKLQGFRVNRAEGNRIFPADKLFVKKGMKLYRNSDHAFNQKLIKNLDSRKIKLDIKVIEKNDSLYFNFTDEDQNSAEIILAENFDKATNPDAAIKNISKQLSKLGNTDFYSDNIETDIKSPVFIPASKLNEIRRDLISKLEEIRIKNYKRQTAKFTQNNIPYINKDVDYMANIVNKKAAAFYERHGVENFEEGFELQNNYDGKTLMTTKHCLRFEFGICKKYQKKSEADAKYSEPLYLTDKRERYLLEFDCDKCFMK